MFNYWDAGFKTGQQSPPEISVMLFLPARPIVPSLRDGSLRGHTSRHFMPGYLHRRPSGTMGPLSQTGPIKLALEG
jgi:hypothetical protein